MTIRRFLVLSALAFAPIITFAQGPILHGQLILVDENGQATPAPKGIEMTIPETGGTDLTDGKGLFRIPLPKVFQPGSLITIDAAKAGWQIWQPEEGRASVPQGLLTVKLLQKGSKRFWTDSHIQAFIESTGGKVKQQVSASKPGEPPKPIDFAPLIRDWAVKYGFTPEEAKAQIDKWVADVETSQQDFYKLGLAAFADRNFGKAGALFDEAGQTSEKQMKAVEKQQGDLAAKHTALLQETVRNYQKEGDSYYSGYSFSKAQAAYQKAVTFIDRKSDPALWAEIQLEIGMASHELATRSEGNAIAQNFAHAVAAYRAALEVRTREQLPQDWAATQNNLSNALREQGTRRAGAEGRQLLAQAVAAYRAALEVRTREQLPQDWAITQNNLGIALREQGTRSAGEEGRQLLAQAVAAYRAALEVYTREQLPQAWATTQNNLGNALDNQGTRSAGEDGRQLLAQAVAAYRAALEVYTREQSLQAWAATQNNLGIALDDQGTRSAGEEGRQLLAQAVAAYRAALEVYTREQLPQDWAMTQNNLGFTLMNQSTRSAGEEGRQLLAQAVAAYRAALEVRTREQLPQAWARTQNNLGNALREQGTRSAGAEGRQLLAQAVAAYRAALEVYTREQLPQDWAMTQNNLGTALDDQGTRSAAEEGRQLLAQAVAAYRAALEVYTREQLPQDWATTQNNLGIALDDQGTRSAAEEGRQLLAQAVAAYRAALEVRTREQLPQDWATTQNNLAKAYAALADWQKAAECYLNVLQIDPDYEAAYKMLAYICHERLFDFATAVAIHQDWTKKHSTDSSAQSDLAESLFTAGRFSEAQLKAAHLRNDQTIPMPTRAALQALEIASLSAQKQTEAASAQIIELRKLIATQPADFKITWTWDGTLHFVQTDDHLASQRSWLESLFKALQGENRDAILASLSAVAENPGQ